jgi:hypothetical protein
MITITFYDPADTVVCRLSARDRAEETETVPVLLRRMQQQMGWDGTKPGHHFCTRPMIGAEQKRQVIYYINSQRVGWYVYHNHEVKPDAAPSVHRRPSYLRQWLHRCRDQAKLCQEWIHHRTYRSKVSGAIRGLKT